MQENLGLPSSVVELGDPYSTKKLVKESQDPLVYAMVLMGLASVMTWALCVMAVDDFNRQLPHMDAEYRIAAAYKTSVFFCGLSLLAIGPSLQFRGRIMAAFLLQLLCVAGVLHLSAHNEPMAFWLTLFAAAGCGQAWTHGSLSGMCASAPERYLRALIVGLGLSTVLIAILKLTTKSFIADPAQCERVWLVEIIALYVLSVVVYLKVVDTDESLQASATMSRHSGEHENLLGRSSRPWLGRCARDVFSKTRFWMALMTINWITTMIVFPGLTSDLDSTSLSLQQSGWYHVIMFFAFVLFDVFGRVLTGIPALRSISDKQLVILTLLRCLCVPLFIAINKYDGPHQHMDTFALAAVIAVGVSNGYSVTICCLAPCAAVDITERETCGTFTFLFYIFGQSLGVLFGLALKLSNVVPDF